MGSETGRVNELAEACVTIRFISGQTIECVIDTGFSGGLMLPRSFIEQIPYLEIGRETFILAGGGEIKADVVAVEASWLNNVQSFASVISEGGDALIGTDLLKNTVLRIDYISSQVEINDEKEI
jgi:clan AA aspartic protease